MKLCVVQIKPTSGEVAENIQKHIDCIKLAVEYEVDVIVFSELSITAYEPDLAKKLATQPDDERFKVFQVLSNEHDITIGIGMPIRQAYGITISMLLFQANEEVQVYAKKYIHPDEEPFFVAGINEKATIGETDIALAICYEVFVPEHVEDAAHQGAKFYLASVAKSQKGMDKAMLSMPMIAKRYNMPVLMANCLGYCDNFESVGQSAVWSNTGNVLAQLDAHNEGIIVYDTETQEAQAILMEQV